MTEQQPPNPPGPQPGADGPEPAPEAPAPEAQAPTPPGPVAGPTAYPGPYAYPPGAPPPAALYGDPTFLAPPRPRVRWVNPQRRVHVAGAALAIALACTGAGVAIGWAASDHHDRGQIGIRLAPGYGGRYLPGPGRVGPNRLPRPAAPVPTPTSTR